MAAIVRNELFIVEYRSSKVPNPAIVLPGIRMELAVLIPAARWQFKARSSGATA
jgi:hypothetical protein